MRIIAYTIPPVKDFKEEIATTDRERWAAYLNALEGPFLKLARLDFLQPDGSLAFSIDNNHKNRRAGAFIQEGELTVNLQNGQRRQAAITLSNLDGEYDFNVNKVWFGQQIRLMEGLVLPDGTDYYLPQGVFYVKDPEETFEPGRKTARYTLADKWAYLDGTLFGNLEGTYQISRGENLFNAVTTLLQKGRGNGQPIDNVPPVFTTYYNDRTVTLPDGTTASWLTAPYTYRCESENGTYAEVLLEVNKMLVGWMGYDQAGHFRVDAAYEDILDTDKPVQYQLSPERTTFLGCTYTIKNTEVYNDIIVRGTALKENEPIPTGRAINADPRSDTNVNILGYRTQRRSETAYYADGQCQELAEFYLKRNTVLQKSVTVQTSQIFHLTENNLVTIQRTDKPGSPVERHLLTGFSRPIGQTGAMQLNCTSVNDFPLATAAPMPGE
ncbi:hypothetical protein [Flintibacter muris]|uniref:hypothetical protein n=1 Tax=Flintibacter muris TaxID=2941327 RepID=UPI002040326A|nr:hypothetical protein [Flintibacter muris]